MLKASGLFFCQTVRYAVPNCKFFICNSAFLYQNDGSQKAASRTRRSWSGNAAPESLPPIGKFAGASVRTFACGGETEFNEVVKMMRRKNLERAVILGLLLSTSVYGSAWAEDIYGNENNNSITVNKGVIYNNVYGIYIKDDNSI